MKKKTTSILLLAMLLLPSCVTYQKTSVSLGEAQDKGKVKVTTTMGDDIKFKNIKVSDGVYYGISGKHKIKILPNQIEFIYLQDIKKSKTLTIIFLLSPIIILGIGKLIHLALGSPI